MPDIFISWSNDDAAVVKPVVARLKAYGWSLYFSGDNAEAGKIDENVADAIEGASAMVLFVSPRTTQKPWLQQESFWASSAQARQKTNKRQILKLIPVLIGDVSLKPLNYFLARDDMNLRLQIPDPVPLVPGQAFAGNSGGTLQVPDEPLSEGSLHELVTRIRNAIDLPPPIQIPSVLLAMNLEEAKMHFDIAEHQATLNGLCKAMGMATFPALREELLKRYGKTADDFCPFEENERIKDLVEAARGSLNAGLLEGSSPLELWWCRDEFFGAASPNKSFARHQIANGPLLVVLDSISALSPAVLGNYNTVAATHLSGSSALLWVPPYTSHTKGLRSLWSTVLEPTPGLLARLETWGASTAEPHVLFDISTAESLRAWSFGALRTLGAQVRSSNSRQQRLNEPPAGRRPLVPFE